MPTKIEELDEWQEKDFVSAQKDKLVCVVEFGAPWCSACKATEPAIVEISKAFPAVKFAKIDVAKNSALASRMGVMSVPNILVLNGGNIKDQIIGAVGKKAIEERIGKIVK